MSDNNNQPAIDLTPRPVTTIVGVNHTIEADGTRMVTLQVAIPGAGVIGWVTADSAKKVCDDIWFHATGLHRA